MFANLCMIILLPLVPAYLLFRALPSNANVSGPMQGLQIKLGGAFAGYFALLILIFGTHNIWNPPQAFQVWKVQGKIMDQSGAGLRPLDVRNFKLFPESFATPADGEFLLSFTTQLDQGGKVQFPELTIDYPEYKQVSIHLNPSEPDFPKDLADVDGHVIRLKPIKVERLQPYPYAQTAETRMPDVTSRERNP
jgi:phosphotransferase system  glucose/maltose/N-acetylglucosamine-specific IIC component